MSGFRKQTLLKGVAVLMLVVPITAQVAAQTDSVWIGGTGNWNVGPNWDPAGVPNGAFNVFIDDGDAGNSVVTIPTSQDFSVDSLTIDFGDRLQVANNGGLRILTDVGRPNSGLIANEGTILISNNFNSTDLHIDGAVSLMGMGTITLDGGSNTSRIHDGVGINASDGVLTNFENVIQGKGQIGVNNLQVVNGLNGTIVANDPTGVLTLDPRGSDPMVNMGLMQADGSVLVLTTGSYNNAGGTIEALASSAVTLNGNATITGGTLQTTGDGQIAIPDSTSATLIGVSIDGTLNVGNNTDLFLAGTITNMGNTINAVNNFNNSDIVVDAAASLQGGGAITLSGGSTTSRIVDQNGSDGVLTNVDNVIQGKGQIGVNSLQVINQTNGLIDANNPGNTLTLDPPASAAMLNSGVMQASGGGVLVISGNGGGVVDNSGGIIEAADASTVSLVGSGTVTGGLLQTSGSGQFEVPVSNVGNLSDLTVDGTFVVQNNADLNLTGTITSLGSTINLVNNFNNTDLHIDEALSLNGGGTITLSGGGNTSRLVDERGSNGSDGILTNVDNAIQGKGQIGGNSLQVINQTNGLIDANDAAGNPLTLDPRPTDPMLNSGILQASNGGLLVIHGNGGGIIDNTNGVIEAADASTVRLTTGGTVTGGTLQSSGSGQFVVPVSDVGNLSDLTIDATFVVLNNADLNLSGTISSLGNTINLVNNFNNTDAHIDEALILNGGGTITLSGGANTSRLVDEKGTNGSDGVLTNVDNLIQGKGQIGANNLQVINEPSGTIDANDPSGSLTLDPRNSDPMLNAGTLRASAGGVLAITGNGGGFVDNTGGVIEAADGSTVVLTTGGLISGGTLQSAGNGTFQIPVSSSATVVDLSIAGTVVQNNNSDFFWEGNIENLGNVNVVNNFNLTDLTINSSVVVTGAGSINLIGGANTSRIEGSGDIEIVGGTLTGNGQVVVPSFLDGATVSPGTSIGILQFTGTHTMTNATQWDVELGALTGTPGTNWDLINVTGTLDLDDGDLDPGIVVKGISLDANGDPGELAGFQTLSDYSWLIARATTVNDFDPSNFTYDLTEFQNDVEGAFTTTLTGGDIVLNYLGGAVCLDSGDVIEGFGNVGTVDNTCESDNVFWQSHGATFAYALTDPVVQFETTATAPAGYSGGPFRVHVEARKQSNAANLNIQARVFKFNDANPHYVQMPGVLALQTTDLVKTYDLPAGAIPSDFVEAGTGRVQVLLQTIQTSGLPNVRTQIDHILVNFD